MSEPRDVSKWKLLVREDDGAPKEVPAVAAETEGTKFVVTFASLGKRPKHAVVLWNDRTKLASFKNVSLDETKISEPFTVGLRWGGADGAFVVEFLERDVAAIVSSKTESIDDRMFAVAYP